MDFVPLLALEGTVLQTHVCRVLVLVAQVVMEAR